MGCETACTDCNYMCSTHVGAIAIHRIIEQHKMSE